MAIGYYPTEEPDAKEVVELIQAAGRKAVPLPGDIREEAFCQKLVADAMRELGGLDILVSNAGRQQARDSILDLSTEDFDATYKTNCYAPFWIMKAAVPHLQPGASIIFTASVQATDPSPNLFDYASTKAVNANFAKSLSKQLAPKGIRVNAVAPGPVWTPLQVSGGQPPGKASAIRQKDSPKTRGGSRPNWHQPTCCWPRKKRVSSPDTFTMFKVAQAPHSFDGRRGFVRVRGAREHNLKNVDVDIPRDALVVFTGVSGSGKSSLAFGTLYAEAQRRYLESVAPYARRLFHQIGTPAVDEIEGLPPAVALQQQRGSPTTRSSVGSVTTLSNLLRMLYSRAGDYPPGQPLLYAESFSPNTPEGACPQCHGLGRVYEVTEKSMVPDDSLSIRERAIVAWPPAWHGQNLRDIVTTLGFDIDKPWRDLPGKDRDWLLLHGGTTSRAGLCRLDEQGSPRRDQTQRTAQLYGHLYRRAEVCARDICEDRKPIDEKARLLAI